MRDSWNAIGNEIFSFQTDNINAFIIALSTNKGDGMRIEGLVMSCRQKIFKGAG